MAHCFKLPLANDPSKSILVENYEVPGGGDLSCVYENDGGKFCENYLKKSTENMYKIIREQLDNGEITTTEYLKKRMKISGGFKLNKNYLFETKDLFFLKDIRKEPEESRIGKWFKENKNEIESYAKGFPWGKAVAGVGAAVLFEELIRKNLPKDENEENSSNNQYEQRENNEDF